ncbi:zinc ribbon domain-containing protein [Bradyrhizobium sp. 139]|uniref:zinc ribbon domain-containing protein n=1 Tax=Bradyrhizobium sp. 139 TaxID=2782616 RepID=UPI002112B6BF|nr:zinc ribbon domain-containing protein [Bradyrhizobium sp. 139]MCK1744283.1 zinc ribbon domain-containing protein [Bradyrhizobium sp. 139]
MPVLFSIRKACPACGKPMVAVPDKADDRRLRYVCTACDGDPLCDLSARKWADGPLRPPTT